MPQAGPHVEYERRGHILLLTLHRPPVNALNYEVLEEIRSAMKAAAEDPSVRVVVLTARGNRVFAAGADIKELPHLDSVRGQAINARFQGAFDAVAACPVPVICALNGLALGGGLELAMACDILLAAENASFGLPEAALGLIPGGGGTQRLPRLIPPGKAKEMIFSGRRMGAAEALQYGLVGHVVAAGELLPAALKLGEEIAALGPAAVRAVKAAVNRGLDLPLDQALELELELSSRLFGTEESREGISAFFAKRTPAFSDPSPGGKQMSAFVPLTKSYHQGLGPILPLGKTLGEYVEDLARKVPDKVVIIYRDRRITYREINATVDRLALALIDLGLKKGDKLAICLPDVPEYTFLYYACAKLGVVTSPVSPRYREREFRNILGHAGSSIVVVPAQWKGFDFLPMLDSLRPELSALRQILVVGGHPRTGQGDVRSLSDMLATDWSAKYPDDYLHQVYLKENPIDGDTLLEIAYTSGTTGIPKGVMQSHNGRVAAAMLNNEAWGARETDVMIAMAPLCHSTGSNHSQNAAILGRYAVVYLEGWDAEHCLAEIERNRGTILIGVPAMYIAMMNHPNFAKYDLVSVRGLWCAGAPVPLEVARRFTEAFGATFIQCYGTTECGGNHNTHIDDQLEVSCGSVGPSVRNMECKIVDAGGSVVPIGQPGEVCARGPMRFLGYYNYPEATAAVIDSAGWFHSGDLGVMDEKGYVRIIGRIKDMIIRGGLNIYATDIEEVLFAHPDVEQVYVVGYPDDYLGERTCAFIKPKDPQHTMTRDSLVAFLDGKLAKYKIPDRVEIVTELPMTPSGKVQKHLLRELLLAKLKEEERTVIS